MFTATTSLFEQVYPRTMFHAHLVKPRPRPFLAVQAQDRGFPSLHPLLHSSLGYGECSRLCTKSLGSASLCGSLTNAYRKGQAGPRPTDVSLRFSSRRLVRALSCANLSSKHVLQVFALSRLRHQCILGPLFHLQLVVTNANDFPHRNC